MSRPQRVDEIKVDFKISSKLNKWLIRHFFFSWYSRIPRLSKRFRGGFVAVVDTPAGNGDHRHRTKRKLGTPNTQFRRFVRYRLVRERLATFGGSGLSGQCITRRRRHSLDVSCRFWFLSFLPGTSVRENASPSTCSFNFLGWHYHGVESIERPNAVRTSKSFGDFDGF